ncbi:MAG: hypothetical protein JXA10_15865 [Anaerolineae bacterium]|nr:hypothetical protein [Anaerolineae bacterium]
MLRRYCRCAFLITGVLMVLLAVGLALSIELDVSQVSAPQVERAYVAQAVNQLENGCLTCHDLVNTAPQIEAVALVGLFDSDQRYERLAVQTPEISGATTVSRSLPTQFNTRLLDMGQRILNLPDMQSQRLGTVVDDYIYTYDLYTAYAQTGAAGGEPVRDHLIRQALGQLDAIEHLLNILEHQAAPYHVVRQDNQLTMRTSPAALYTLTTLTTAPGVAVLVESVSVSDSGPMQFARLDVTQLAMPQEIVFATHRRGPPASVVLDSVL